MNDDIYESGHAGGVVPASPQKMLYRSSFWGCSDIAKVIIWATYAICTEIRRNTDAAKSRRG